MLDEEHCGTVARGHSGTAALEHSGTVGGEHCCTALLGPVDIAGEENFCILALEHCDTPGGEPGGGHSDTAALEHLCILVLALDTVAH